MNRRLAVQGLLGVSGGLPYYLTQTTLAAWMASAGVDVETIGLFALVSLPYNVRFLWAPLLDRYRLPRLGRRRGWIAALQVALAAAIAAMGSLDVARQPTAAPSSPARGARPRSRPRGETPQPSATAATQ